MTCFWSDRLVSDLMSVLTCITWGNQRMSIFPIKIPQFTWMTDKKNHTAFFVVPGRGRLHLHKPSGRPEPIILMSKNYLDTCLHGSRFWDLQWRRHRPVPLGLVHWVTETWNDSVPLPVELCSEQWGSWVVLEEEEEGEPGEKWFTKYPEKQELETPGEE